MWTAWWGRIRDGAWLEQPLFGNPLRSWMPAVATFVVAWALLLFARGILSRRGAVIRERTGSDLAGGMADLAAATKWWFLVLAAAFLATLGLSFDAAARTAIDSAAIIALLAQGGIWGTVLLGLGVARYLKRRPETDAAARTTMSTLGFLGKLALWTVVALLILDNAGVQVTALIAGLGVGGIAVALAAQNILGDLFASLSIVIDKPFLLGDSLTVDEYTGTVEHIGMRTTRLRSLSGEEIIFPNGELLKSRIRNFKRMRERRALFTIGVTYDTPPDTLAAIPGMIREIVTAQTPVRFDRAHFKSFGDSALVFEVVYFVTVPDYAVFMDVQQAINLAICRKFAEGGIEFAFPTQTVHVHSPAPRDGSGGGTEGRTERGTE